MPVDLSRVPACKAALNLRKGGVKNGGVMESVQNDLGKTTISPKPELRGFGGIPIRYSPPFGVTPRQEMVAIIR